MADERRNDPAPKGGDRPAGAADENTLGEDDLAADRMGDNELQGNDQESVRNQRQAQAEVKQKADRDTLDAFRKMDRK